jgi:predicted Zn-dependent peptidase
MPAALFTLGNKILPKTWHHCLIGVLLFLSNLSLPAQTTNPKMLTPIGQQYLYDKLNNQLEILKVQSDQAAPLVHLTLMVRGGYACQTRKYKGAAYLIPHLLLTPNKHYPTEEALNEKVKALAISWSARIYPESFVIQMSCPQKYWRESCQLLYQLISEPAFYDDHLLLAKAIVESEASAVSRPTEAFIQLEFNPILWPNNSHAAKGAKPELAAVRNITVDQLRQFHQSVFQPNNSLLVVQGLGLTNPQPVIDQYWGNWKASTPTTVLDSLRFQPMKRDSLLLAIHENAKSAVAMWGWHLPSARDSQAINLAAQLYARMMTVKHARFTQMMNERELTYGIFCHTQPSRYRGSMTLSIIPHQLQFESCMNYARKELRASTKPNYFSADDLFRAQQGLIAQYYAQQEDVFSWMHQLQLMWSVNGTNAWLKYPQLIENVSLKQVQEFAARYLLDNPLVIGVQMNSTLAQLTKAEDLFEEHREQLYLRNTLTGLADSSQSVYKVLEAIGNKKILVKETATFINEFEPFINEETEARLEESIALELSQDSSKKIYVGASYIDYPENPTQAKSTKWQAFIRRYLSEKLGFDAKRIVLFDAGVLAVEGELPKNMKKFTHKIIFSVEQ